MTSKLAIDGGKPVRDRPLPYGRQHVDDSDVAAVVAALTSDWLTTGPRVGEFEGAFAAAVGAGHAVAVSNGTAALHCAMHAVGVRPGDEVVVSPMTFAATANAVVYCGGTPVFADVDDATLLVDPLKAAAAVTKRTRAVASVDYAGHPVDATAFRSLAAAHGLKWVSDACHALGGSHQGKKVGSLADVSTFSLHPVKPITTGEGGVVTTDDAEIAARVRIFRNHGITSDHRSREKTGSFFYEMVDLGYNYRLTDIQCALGLSQLKRLPSMVARRRALAERYAVQLADIQGVRPLRIAADVEHGWHIYVVRFDLERVRVDRAQLHAALRAEGVLANVHYVPVHLHPYYRERFGTRPGMFPVAERAYAEMLTLPLFVAMTESDVDDVVVALKKVLDAYRR